MKKASKRGKKQPGFRDALLAWYGAKRSVLLYAGKFAGLVLLFCLLALTPVYQSLLEKEVVWKMNSQANQQHWQCQPVFKMKFSRLIRSLPLV